MHTSEGQLLFILTGATLIVGGLISYFLVSLVRHFGRYRRMQDGYNQSKLEALEQERQLIAADLHDDIGPILSATLYKLGDIEPVTEEERKLLGQAYEYVDSIYTRIRIRSTMMVPMGINIFGSFAALGAFAEKYLAGQSLHLDISPIQNPELDEYRSLHLFRMLQEILHNTVKHAKATSLTINARIIDQVLHIETGDDGIGYDPSRVHANPGLGLQNLATRARMIGARMITHSWPGEGTRYTIIVPLNPAWKNERVAEGVDSIKSSDF